MNLHLLTTTRRFFCRRREPTPSYLWGRQVYSITSSAFKTTRKFPSPMYRHFTQSGLGQCQERSGKIGNKSTPTVKSLGESAILLVVSDLITSDMVGLTKYWICIIKWNRLTNSIGWIIWYDLAQKIYLAKMICKINKNLFISGFKELNHYSLFK